jgi:hypothetical protein
MIGYKIFRNRDLPTTLFHGIDGSKTLPLNKWIQAEKKRVWNPGERVPGKSFMSGLHFYSTKGEAIEYMNTRFKNLEELCVCRVNVRDAKEKPRSKGCMLAAAIKILGADWRKQVLGTKKCS